MKNDDGQNLLSKNLQQHKPFSIYDNDGLFARYEYDDELKRYQSKCGYLTIEGVLKIAKDETDERKIIWE